MKISPVLSFFLLVYLFTMPKVSKTKSTKINQLDDQVDRKENIVEDEMLLCRNCGVKSRNEKSQIDQHTKTEKRKNNQKTKIL